MAAAYHSLSSHIQPRVKKAIQSLSQNPPPQGVKKLMGKLKGAWRIRIGDYRLLYDIDDKLKKVVLIDMGHRKQIYR